MTRSPAPASPLVQPEQEYIITESMLRIWRNQCVAEPAHTDTDHCKKCQYRGKGARIGCCDFGESDMEKIFRSRPAPAADAPNQCYHTGYSDGAQKERENVIEILCDLNKYSCFEYEEANLSDNEREMRIHLEYGNRLWGIIRSLRSTNTKERAP